MRVAWLGMGITMDTRHITVKATGTHEAPPDVVTITATAVATGASAGGARSTARSRGDTIRSAVSRVVPGEIATVDMRVQSGAANFDPDMEADFRAVEEFQLRCDPESVSDAVVDITDSGGTVQTVRYQLTTETRATAEDEALQAAMDRAQQKAENIAGVEGLAVGETREVTTQRVATGREAVVDDAWDSSESLHPAPIVVSEAVEVTYELIDP
jgi:uncharacterized protein YggE